ncbi:MAG: hypothetical protein KIT84_19745 [Labilithrix sp.]|nr:hypothetical protein [Labilithrix sp.]MCW5813271.1 hypothetical protein [Labilithrix sp.]
MFALGAAVIAACSSGGEPTGSTCPEGSTLTYETFGRSFLETHCTKCHSAAGRGESPALDSVANVRANATSIDSAAAAGPKATNTEMPEDSDVAEAERRKLGEWLACGAP